jgi:DNA-binding transcriptional MerR regulator
VRTSEVAARLHVNTQTLRYYERRGLLPRPERTRSGFRANTGSTLNDVEELLNLADGPASCGDAKTMARTRIADLQPRPA